jgi:glutamate dehydrogenase (NADP+)
VIDALLGYTGIDAAKLRTLVKIKSERGARIGRYIIASTTAQYSDKPEDLLSVPCDLVFPCAARNEINGKLILCNLALVTPCMFNT